MNGKVNRRGDTWQYVIYLPYDSVKDKYPRKYKQGFATKKEATQALKIEMAKLENGETDQKDITTEELLIEWLQRSVKDHTAIRTYGTYKQTCDIYIIPYIGKIKLTNLTPQDIETMYNELASRLASSTVHRTHRVLRTALNRAVKWGYLNKSPLQRTEPPKLKIDKRIALSPAQIDQLLTYLKTFSPETYMASVIAIYTGMRRGEVLGLQWQDVDFKQKIIHVQRSKQFFDGKIIISSTKTILSARAIPFGDTLATLLIEWKKNFAILKNNEGNDFVLQRLDGNTLFPEYITKHFALAIKTLLFPHVTFHDLRHTHATSLLLGQVPLKIVSERLGHASIQQTADTYSHVTETMQRDAVNRLEEILRSEDK